MKQFVWRFATSGDYDRVFVPWWEAWGFSFPPKECLPERGIIVSDAEGDLYGGFLYLTDGGIGWMEWIVSDRKAAPARKRGALEFLTETLSAMAADEGMLILFTSTNLPGFRNGLVKCGFGVGDTGMFQLVKTLNKQ